MHEKMYAQMIESIKSGSESAGSGMSIFHHLFSLEAEEEDDEPKSPGQTAADEGDMVELTVTIPANVRPGQIIAHKTDWGQVVHVPVPEDAFEGQTVKFKVPREQLGDSYKDDDDKAQEKDRDESVLALAQMPNRKKVAFVVLPRNKKLGLRKGPTFDAERTSENVTRGCVLPYGKGTAVLKDAKVVRMYRLDDGRGWVHDFNPDASTPGVIQCTLVRVRMSPGGLAALLEEPELPTNGGALAIASMKPDSPLHQVDVRIGDLLVLVNEVGVVGYGQAELSELMASLRASEKTLTFLRPTAAGDQIDDTARDESVLGLAALASGAHVVHAITPKAIGLRSQAAFPGEDARTGVIIAPGSVLPYNRSRVVPAELPTYGHVEPTMYCLSDGRGWAHDFDPERLFLANLTPSVVLHVQLDAGMRLGVNVEEPDTEFEAGGGHVVTELNSDSPLKARGVQVGDLLVMVNHVAVSGHEPGELGELLGQLANEDKTITFIRKVADPSETPSDEHTIGGAILKLKDAREKTRVIQVVAANGIGLRQGAEFALSPRTGEVAPPGIVLPFSNYHQAPREEDGGGGNVTMFEVPGQGWLHDLDPDAADGKAAYACELVRAVVPAGAKLGIVLEEPDAASGGGHPLQHVQESSPLAEKVRDGDVLVLVDEVVVVGKTQEELVGLMTQRNDKDKKLLLLRRMSDEALASGARRTLMGTSSKSMLDIGAEMIMGGESEPVAPSYKPETPKPAESQMGGLSQHLSGMVRGLLGGDAQEKAEPEVELVEFEVAVPDGVAPGQQFRVALDECVPVAAPRALPRASPLLAPPSRARAFRFGTIVLTVPDDGPEVMTVRIPRGSMGGESEEI